MDLLYLLSLLFPIDNMAKYGTGGRGGFSNTDNANRFEAEAAEIYTLLQASPYSLTPSSGLGQWRSNPQVKKLFGDRMCQPEVRTLCLALFTIDCQAYDKQRTEEIRAEATGRISAIEAQSAALEGRAERLEASQAEMRGILEQQGALIESVSSAQAKFEAKTTQDLEAMKSAFDAKLGGLKTGLLAELLAELKTDLKGEVKAAVKASKQKALCQHDGTCNRIHYDCYHNGGCYYKGAFCVKAADGNWLTFVNQLAAAQAEVITSGAAGGGAAGGGATRQCSFFIKGKCKHGTACKFAH